MEERKLLSTVFFVNIITGFILLSCWQFHYVAAFFGGAWCPYKTDKLIPCRVHNGTESYLGPNICWKSFNGSFACTKRILNRPKYVTTYKRVSETIYKCCPGLEGHNCQKDCFNCSTLRVLESRLGYLETKLNQIQLFSPVMRHDEDKGFGSGHEEKNSIGEDDDEDFERTLSIANDLRGLKTRLVRVESQLAKLIHSIGEIVRPGPASTAESAIVPSSEEKKMKSHFENSVMTDKNSIPTTEAATSREHHGGPGAESSIRLLETNLERGDIASTLNDDYGDETIPSARTEEYADQLYSLE